MSIKTLLKYIGEDENIDNSSNDNNDEQINTLLNYIGEGSDTSNKYNTAYDSPYSVGTVLDSKYDKGALYGTNINESRANQQTITDKWLNGLGKATGVALTSTGEGIGVILGGIPAILAGDSDLAFKNPVVNFFSQTQKSIDKSLPNYQSEGEQNNSLLEDLGTTNFWSDKFLRGAGYMAGNLIPATGIMKAGKAFKTAVLASKANKLNLASNIVKDVSKVNNLSKIIDGGTTVTASIIGNVGEAALEANDAYDQIKNDLLQKKDAGIPEFQLSDEQIEDRAKDGRMATFGANMLLAIPDIYQYGKLFGNFNNSTKALNKIRKNSQGMYETMPMSRLEKLIYKAKEPLRQGAVEAGEENLQLAISNTTRKLAENDYSDESKSYTQDMLTGIADEFLNNFTTKEGVESMFIGSLLGAPMGAYIGARDSKIQNAETQNAIQNLNSVDQSVKNNMVAFTDLEGIKNKSIQDGNIALYKFAKNAQFESWVKSKLDADKFDDFILELEAWGKSNPEEIKSLNITEQEENSLGVEKDPEYIANSAINEAKKLKKIYESVNNTFPNTNQRDRDYLYYNLANQEYIDSKLKTLSNKIVDIDTKKAESEITGIPYAESIEDLNIINDYNELKNAKIDLIDKYRSMVDPKYVSNTKPTLPTTDQNTQPEVVSEDVATPNEELTVTDIVSPNVEQQQVQTTPIEQVQLEPNQDKTADPLQTLQTLQTLQDPISDNTIEEQVANDKIIAQEESLVVTPDNIMEELNRQAGDLGFDNVTHIINAVNKDLGTDYKTIQDIPQEEIEKASENRRPKRETKLGSLVDEYNQNTNKEGLTKEKEKIDKLANQLGYKSFYNPDTEELELFGIDELGNDFKVKIQESDSNTPMEEDKNSREELVPSQKESENKFDNEEMMQIIDKLQEAIPGVEIITDLDKFKEVLNANGYNNNNLPLGFEFKGKVYLNPDKATLETPIHEFGHVFINYIEKNNPELYKKGINLIKESNLLDEVRKFYPGLSEEEMYKEALAESIGKQGIGIFNNKNKEKKFVDYIKEFWTSIAELFGFSKGDAPYIGDLLQASTIEQFSYSISSNLLDGKPPLQWSKDQINNYNKELQFQIDKSEYAKHRDSYGKKESIKQIFLNKKSDFGKWLDKVITPISYRIDKISPELYKRMLRFENDNKVSTSKDYQGVIDFIKGYNGLTKIDQADLDFALKNKDKSVIEEIVKRNGILDAYTKMRKVLENIYLRAKEVGYDMGYIEDYFPRSVKDFDGMMDYFGVKNKGLLRNINNKIFELEQDKGEELSKEEKAEIADAVIRGYPIGNIALSKTNNIKERTIESISADLDKYYEPSIEALIKYIYQVNQGIESRRLFGKGDNVTKTINLKDSIGSIVIDLMSKGNITSQEAQELSDMLKARFSQKMPNEVFSFIRNLGYGTTMNSPLSAITQLADLSLSIFNSGIGNTLSATSKSVSNDPNRITLKDLGIDDIAQEFSDISKTGKLVKNLFKITGLSFMDRIGKEAFVNSAYSKLKEQAERGDDASQAALREKLSKYLFEDEIDGVIKDLKDGKMSDLVNYVLFGELSQVQPISLLEVPEGYLKGGNLRLLYMLKTYSIKQLTLFRSKIQTAFFDKNATKEQKVKAIKDLIRLAGLLMLMGITTDEIKDFILGREVSFRDKVMDNMLKIAGLNKYTIYQGRKEGLGKAAASFVIPPVPYIDYVMKDINKGKVKETPNLIPYGKLFYSWFFKRD